MGYGYKKKMQGIEKRMTSSKLFLVWAPTARRANELSKAINAKFIIMSLDIPKILAPLKYTIFSIKTLYILLINRPEIFFTQNPPIFLSLVALFYCKLTNSKLIMDTHGRGFGGIWQKHIFKWISKYVATKAHLNLISDSWQEEFLKNCGGKYLYLPDPIPKIENAYVQNLKGKYNIAVVNSFSPDEPLSEILKAAEILWEKNESISFYITGNLRKAKKEIIEKNPGNVIFTGFIPDDKYVSLLKSSDAIMVLTTDDDSLVCGGFEALAIEKPLILSDTPILTKYFKKGAVFTKTDVKGIVKAVYDALQNKDKLVGDIKILKIEKEEEWNKKLDTLKDLIEN
jgi:glycosyltransferase involved in cell wall biosynthesis